MTIKSIEKIKNLKGQSVFLRVDFNVPLKKGKIQDDYRLSAGLETIKLILAAGGKIIIATHLGEPAGKVDKNYSLRPVARRLEKLLKQPVKFQTLTIGPAVTQAVRRLKAGEIIMLENLRFNPGELKNDPAFAKELAALADLYVNDAFAVSHRDQASVSAIKKYLPSYAGLLLAQEIRAANKILKPKKPLVVIMGGAKIRTKAPLIGKLYPAANQILLGGALANNFFKFQGFEIGRSVFDADSQAFVKKFFTSRQVKSKIILPLDVVVKTNKGLALVRSPQAVQKDDIILDIGPATISLYAQYIKKAQTLIWNGPMGKFEESSFKHGTLAVARLVAARAGGPAYGLIGGGETVEALKLTKMAEYVDWISTAGGALLTYLGGGKMPGLSKIIK